MTKILNNNLPLIILSFIAIFVCFTNYRIGTILSGWDTLHPEFNFGLALEREIFGVFRNYQGLGAVAAHSDMADLPRIILLAAFDIFLPLDFLRYSYIFLTLILGPIGMYLFLYRHVLKEKTSSFLGGLFYLLNLGTLQQFVVPFEMFVTQYGTLPWIFLFATSYIYNKTNQKRTLLLFALVTILASPQAYAATLWYIYFIAFILYLFSLTLLRVIHLRGVTSSHNEVNTERFFLVKKSLTLILLTLFLNSFWILPNIYYIFNHGSQVASANINKLFSEQAFLYNKEFGNIKDIAMLKSFLFDWNVYVGNNHFTQLLSPWIQHLKQPLVQSLAYLFAVLAFVGIIYSIFNPFDKSSTTRTSTVSAQSNPLRLEELRVKILIALLPLLFLCLFFLFNDNPPTSPLYSFLQEHLSLFKEAYRFPQDKVRGVYTFLFAMYFGAGQFAITRLIRHSGLSRISPNGWRFWMRYAYQNDGNRTAPQYIQILIFSILIFYFMLPAFKGQFISPYMRIKIPSVYFEMFKWFDEKEEDARIANLPIHSFWGWDYYNWGFQGAGFIWFGIKQPVLARDFDRWTQYNEQYYREMSYAIYSQDVEALRTVLEKYNIKYILLDKNVITPPNPSKALLYKKTQELLEKEDYVEKVKEFGNSLVVYEVKPKPSLTWSKTPNSHYVIQNPFNINEESKVLYEDLVYKNYGNYIIQQNGAYYPFRNLTNNQGKILPNILKLTQEGVVIRLPKNPGSFTLPSYLETQESLPSDLVVEKSQDQLNITLYPRIPTASINSNPISPIALKSSLPDSENIILSINKKNNFMLNLSSNTPLSLGTVFLNTKSDNTIAVYPSIPNEEIIPDLSTTNYYIEPCEPSINSQKIFEGYRTVPLFGVEKTKQNSFQIFGKNVSLCMTIPLSNILDKLNHEQALLTVKFNYSSNLPLKFCIAKLTNGACQNYKNNSLPYSFGLENKGIQNLGLQFQLDTTQSNEIEKALYDNLSLSLSFPFFTDKFPLRHSGERSDSRIPIVQSDSGQDGYQTVTRQARMTVMLPFSGDEQLSAKITEFQKTTGLCPNQSNNHPSITKKEILKENGDDFIRYSAEEGTACDHFSYQNLSQSQSYLVTITSRNIKGLPLTICVANQSTKHCDIYASLSSTNNFTTDILLLPQGIKNESGFDVNIRNLGIKKTPAVNDLKSIQIIPIPYKWLSQIKASRHSRESGNLILSQAENDGFQLSSRKTSNVLVLPQSFEKGWKAYRIKNYESGIMKWVNTTFPFVFGKEIKTHVLVNNWENGWILNDPKAMKQFNNEAIVILFLPQYLEFLGFVLLVGAIIYLGIFYRK